MDGRKTYAKGICPIMIEPFRDYMCWCDVKTYTERMTDVKKYSYDTEQKLKLKGE
jgi:hypothetical protein